MCSRVQRMGFAASQTGHSASLRNEGFAAVFVLQDTAFGACTSCLPPQLVDFLQLAAHRPLQALNF